MDSFGNYPRERSFDPFSLMLFKALQVVAFLFFIALLMLNPEAREGKIDSKAEFIITMNWPDDNPDDIDLYVEDPLGNIVWYHTREAGFMVLDRDDRGGVNNAVFVNGRRITSKVRQETISIRGIIAGEYTVNVNYFLAMRGGPIPVTVKVEKINPAVEIVAYETLTLDRMGEEKTALRFHVAEDGSAGEIDHRQKSLLQRVANTMRSAK
jgi:hypothetical protein